MVRWIVVASVACTSTVQPPAPSVAPVRPSLDAAPDAAPDAPVDAAADAMTIDACVTPRTTERDDYPVPSDGGGWFFDGRTWRSIRGACDLRDRVVMVDDKTDGPSGGSMWVWNRRDGSASTFRVDETLGHTGHSTSTSNSAPADDRVVDFIRDGTMFHGRVGRSYPTLVDCRTGDDQAAEYLVACSTRQHFVEIDTHAPPACTSFPDGIGWPLSIAVTDAKDARTLAPAQLVTISADRTAWTYRSDDGRIELELRAGAKHGGEVRFAKQKPEPCVMMFSDHRRTP
jgi:hypothetical protein